MTALKKYKKQLLYWRTKYRPRLKATLESTWFASEYVKVALFILLATTLLWSVLGASLHLRNADQLVNPYMFDSWNVFTNAVFPGQHTFLLKWPIFWFIHIFNNTTFIYAFFTIILSFGTVGCLAYVLYRIEKRPLVYGTLILLLSGVLLMAPAQAAPGMLLPLNFAMIANRNIEYILLIICTVLILGSKRVKSRKFLAGSLLLMLLVSSDKLFLTVSVAGSITTLTVMTLTKKWNYSSRAARLLLGSIIAGIAAAILLFIVNTTGLTSISQQTSTTYKLTQDAHSLLLNAFYAGTALLSNFGAHLGIRTTEIGRMPAESVRTLFSFGGPLTLINIAAFLFAVYASIRLIRHIIAKKTKEHSELHVLYITMICMSLSMFAAYIFTDHYAAGDARYLTIFVFTLFIGIAAYVRTRSFRAERLVSIGAAITFFVLLAIPSVFSNAHFSKQVMAETDRRNQTIVNVLKSHPVNVLVGDYWRVLPIRQSSNSRIEVMPLSNCTTPRDVLSSFSWQPNMQQVSFAYISTSDKGLTDFPSCTLDDITGAYGKPNASIVIAGNEENPKEQLLFYDHGAHKSNPSLGNNKTATSPLTLDELPNTTCSKATRLNVVAHEDDDLLFMNPGLQTELNSGVCIRTIYLTAGDAGANQFYWLSREQGSEAAYNHMIGYDSLWIHRTVRLGEKQYVTVANPRGNPRISLIFFRLPDGNLQGSGFSGYGYESLQKLFGESIGSMHAVYGDSSYSKESLINAITRLMQLYDVTDIHTQSTSNEPPLHDHSDHVATAHFADAAYERYIAGSSAKAESSTLKHYAGYDTRRLPENVANEDLHRKTETFLRYAQHDSGVCHSHDECDHTPTYGGYLKRQYTTD